jgi:hypothetical protein
LEFLEEVGVTKVISELEKGLMSSERTMKTSDVRYLELLQSSRETAQTAIYRTRIEITVYP